MVLYYIYLAVLPISAVMASIALTRGLSFHLKIFAVLLIYIWIVEWAAYVKTTYLKDRETLQLYNFFMLVEFMAYGYYFKQILQSTSIKKIAKAFLFGYPVYWFFLVFFIFRLGEWNSLVFIGGSMFTVFFALTYCFEMVISEAPIRFHTHSEFWIAVGLIVFYTCGLPFMGMFNFLTKNYMSLAAILKQVLLGANIVMYSLFAYAYLCQLISTRKS